MADSSWNQAFLLFSRNPTDFFVPAPPGELAFGVVAGVGLDVADGGFQVEGAVETGE